MTDRHLATDRHRLCHDLSANGGMSSRTVLHRGWTSLRAQKPFTYQAVHEESTQIGLRRKLIPPESYFGPTADERKERAEIIFREVPARAGFRK
jgi:hypothetical protein